MQQSRPEALSEQPADPPYHQGRSDPRLEARRCHLASRPCDGVLRAGGSSKPVRLDDVNPALLCIPWREMTSPRIVNVAPRSFTCHLGPRVRVRALQLAALLDRLAAKHRFWINALDADGAGARCRLKSIKAPPCPRQHHGVALFLFTHPPRIAEGKVT